VKKSAWQKGVEKYAEEMTNEIPDATAEKGLLNGAADWRDWVYGGCGLVYNADIAERLCTPSELRRTRNGERRPNRRETWLDVEARAARQAAHLVLRRAARLARISPYQITTNEGPQT